MSEVVSLLIRVVTLAGGAGMQRSTAKLWAELQDKLEGYKEDTGVEMTDLFEYRHVMAYLWGVGGADWDAGVPPLRWYVLGRGWNEFQEKLEYLLEVDSGETRIRTVADLYKMVGGV